MIKNEILKNCPGCGLKKQISDNHSYCEDCYKAVHYGKISNDLIEYKFKDIVDSFEKSDFFDRHFYLVVDFLFLRSNLIRGINKHIKSRNLTLVVNKMDLIPKSIPLSKVDAWVKNILQNENIQVNDIFYMSAKKNHGIEELNDHISNKSNKVGFIGYSNVGKSTIVTKIAKFNNIEALNVISHTIGTTKKCIKFNLVNGVNLADYPGLLNGHSNQNNLTKVQLKKVLPNSEIRVKNFTIRDDFFLAIDDLFFIRLTAKSQSSVQSWFNNLLTFERRNYPKFISNFNENQDSILRNVIINKDVVKKPSFKQMLVINGIGLFILPYDWLSIELYSLDDFYFYIEDSFLDF